MPVPVPQPEQRHVHVCWGVQYMYKAGRRSKTLAFDVTSVHAQSAIKTSPLSLSLSLSVSLSLFVLSLRDADVPHKPSPTRPCGTPDLVFADAKQKEENAPGFGPGRCRNCLLGPSPLAPLLFIKPPSAKPGPSDGLVACTTLTPPETVWRSLLQPLDDHTSPGEDGPSANTRCGTPVTPISEAFVYATLHHTPTLLFSLHLCRRCTTPKKTLVFSHSFNSAF